METDSEKHPAGWGSATEANCVKTLKPAGHPAFLTSANGAHDLPGLIPSVIESLLSKH